MIKKILGKFGYYKIDYGFACGRHWMEINGKMIAQAKGADILMRDEDIHRLGYATIDRGRRWCKPYS